MRGYYGIGIWHPKTDVNVGTLFRSALSFGANFLFTVGARYKKQSSDTTDSRRHVPMFAFNDIGDLKNHLPYGCPLVGIELTSMAHDLRNYVHFERACYMLGAEDHGLSPNIIDECHHLVQIGGLSHCLNVSTAGSIVMYDRMMKNAPSQ